MKKKMVKRLMAAAMATTMVLSMAGCGSSAETASTEEGGSDVETLTVLMYTDWYKAGWEALEQYVNDNSQELGFKLEISKIQGGDQGDQVIKTKFASDDLPDIIQVYKPQWIETNTSNGLDKLVDLSGLDCLSQYDESALNGTFAYGGKTYGVPIDSIVLSGVFYNKEVFSNFGVEVPQTWDEMLAACETFKQAGVVPVYYSAKDTWSVQPPAITGMVSEAAARGIDTFELMNMIDTNQIKYSDCQEFVDAIGRTKELIDKGYVNETYMSDTVDMAHEALANGQCAMYINGTWCADNITQKFPDSADMIGGFAIPTPSGDNYINMFTPYSLCLTTQCKNQELGLKAINFLASKEAQQIYADAQPGCYLNKEITCTIPVATEELKAIMDSGKAMTDWEEINKYSYGNLGQYMMDYYTGTYKDPSDVTKAFDDETEKSAKAMGDPNWE